MRYLCYHKNHYSVLHIAAAYYSDDPTYSELLEIVLDHYDKPEYLDAKTSNNAKSTPLQTAIAMHNQVAVGGFIKAGASIETQDSYSRAALDMALGLLERLAHSRSDADNSQNPLKSIV